MLCGVAALNRVVDPYAQYGTRLLPPAVQTSRADKVRLLAEEKAPVEGLILGSSRVLKLEPDYLRERTGLRFFNAGVTHARPEDMLALVRHFAAARGHFPKMALVGIDVAALRDAAPPDARLIADPDLYPHVPELHTWENSLQPLQELISYQQTRSSLQSLMRFARGKNSEPAESFRPDGMIVYHERQRQREEGKYDFDAALDYNVREYREAFRDYPEISPQRKAMLGELVELLRDHGCRVHLFITPDHPRLADSLAELESYPARRSDTADLLRSLEGDLVSFTDLVSIESFAGDADEFIDGIHPLEKNTRRMIERLVHTRVEEGVDAVQ